MHVKEAVQPALSAWRIECVKANHDTTNGDFAQRIVIHNVYKKQGN